MKIGIYGITTKYKENLINKICDIEQINHISGSNLLNEITTLSIDEFAKLPYVEKAYWKRKYIKELKIRDVYKNTIVDEEYSFFDNDNINIAFTDKELKFYDTFIYVDTPSEDIYNELKAISPSITINEIDNWKNFEINSLSKECFKEEKEFIIVNRFMDKSIEFIESILNDEVYTSSKKIVDHILHKNKELFEENKKIILFTCDNTLSINNASLDLCSSLNIKDDILKENFKENRNTLYQSYLIKDFYDNIVLPKKDSTFDIVSKNSAKIESRLLADLKNQSSNATIVGITSGITDIWDNINKSNEFIDLILGIRENEDNILISSYVKYLLVQKLQELGHEVIAIGSDRQDIAMLEEANSGYIVAYDNLNTLLQNYFDNNNSNIIQLNYCENHYNNISVEDNLL